MALPALEGEIKLTDNSGAALKNFVSAAGSADQALTHVQSTAQATDQALSKIGGNGALKNFVSAIAPAEDALTQVQATAATTDAALSSIGQNASIGGLTGQLGALAAEEELTTEQAQRLQAAFAELAQAQGLTPLVTALGSANTEAQALNTTLSQSAQSDQGAQRVAAIQQEATQRKALIAQLSEATGVSEKRITSIVDSETQRRVSDTAEEVAQRKALIAQLAQATGASEKQITAQIESELSARSGAQSGGGLNVGNLLAQGAAAAGIALSVRAIASEAVELDTLGVKAERVNQAFVVLSGGADQAKARLEAVQRATGGAVTELDAMQAANRAATLGLGKNADELERVTRLLSTANRAQGNGEDIGSSLEQFSQTVANQSARGLARLGINAGEVKDRVEQLKFTMAGATKEEIFLQAALDIGEKTFQGFGDGAVTSASGMEILKTKIENLKNKVTELINLDGATRDFLAIFGDQNIGNQIKVAQDAAQKFATGNNIGSALTGPNQDQATRFTELSLALKSADEAQRRGLPGAEAYAKGVQDAATSAERLGLVTDGNAQSITELVTKYGQGTTAAQIFQAAQGKRLETGAIDELKAKIDALKGAQSGFLGAIVGQVDQGQIDQLEGALHKALENAGKNLPITFENPDLTKLLPDLAGKLPDGKPLDELTAATDRAKNATDLLAVSQQALASGVITQQQLAQVQAQNQVAQADLGVAEAKRTLATATGAYVASLTSTDQKTKDAAQTDVDAAAKAENLAEKRQTAATAAKTLADAQAQLAQAQADGRGDDAAQAQATVELAQAQVAAAGSAFELASGVSAAATDTNDAADAWNKYHDAIRDIESSTIGMIDAQSGLPVAFNAATTSGKQLADVLAQLVREERNLASSAATTSFALGASLAPNLGVAGAIGKGREFQQQDAAIVQMFDSANQASQEAGRGVLSNDILNTGLALVHNYQQAVVTDYQNIGKAGEDAADKATKAFDKANAAVNSALTSMIQGAIKPTTDGLIEGNAAFAKEKDQFGNLHDTKGSLELEQLLPRKDAVDEPARQLATVAVQGFKSEYYQHFKDIDLIPPDVIAKGEFAIRKFAAQKVQLNTEGLSADLLDINTATNNVLEKIQGKQNIDKFIADVQQRVKGLAPDVGITDIKSALGIDTQAEQIGASVKSALSGVLDPTQIFAQFKAALGGGEGGSPIAKSLEVTPENKTTIIGTVKAASAEAGEAAVTQTDTGKYGERMISTITAQIAAKKADLQSSGKSAAGWFGDSFLQEVKDHTPAGLLSILTDKLVPLIQAAQAAQNERTVGAGVAP